MKKISPNVEVSHEISQAIRQIGQIIREDYFEKCHVPPVLYHYTNYEGLNGILRDKKVWATHYKHLEDKTEMSYGDKLIVDHVCKRMKAPKLNLFLHEVYTQMTEGCTITGPFGYNVPYISSFSDAGDLSPQWEDYADNKQGYCIGIKPHKIHGKLAGAYISSKYKHDITFVRVEYDPQKQTELFSQLLNKAEQTILEMMEHASPNVEPHTIYKNVAMTLGFELHGLTLMFKKPSFKEEKEWRVVKLDWHNKWEDSQYDIKWRGKKKDTPYVELDFSSTKHRNLLPLESIYLGSALDNTHKAELKTKLKTLKYTGRTMPRVDISSA